MSKERHLSEFELLPVRFILFVLSVLYFIFTTFWCLPALQLDLEASIRDVGRHRRGVLATVVFHVMLFFFGWSYLKTLRTDPGRIPDTREWKEAPDPLKLRERRFDGKLRYDEREGKYKPDRAHYATAMRRNILKMDHYCPWVANGIGFYNYKFFLLSILHASTCLGFTTFLMAFSLVTEWSNYRIPWSFLFFYFLGSCLGLFIFTIVFSLLCFHIWLASQNMTTIGGCISKSALLECKHTEFFEGNEGPHPYNLGSVLDNFALGESHDYGNISNLYTVLGANPHYWFIPIGEPVGDGLYFPRLIEAKKSNHRRAHRVTVADEDRDEDRDEALVIRGESVVP